MKEPRVERKRGALAVRDMPPALVGALAQLPRLLADDAPGILCRTVATPYPGDDARTGEWERHAVPELAHLFASARTLVLEDLERLRADGRSGRAFRIDIPARHHAAWLSALAAARVALGEAHGISAADMDAPLPDVIAAERDRAVVLVHLLGWMQSLLVQGAG